MFRKLSTFTLLRELVVAFGVAAAVYAIGFGALNVMNSVKAEEGDVLDCPQRLLGLYCPEDNSPVDNPNLDCPGRAFGLYCDCPERDLGLYCSEDPSPEAHPNVGSSGGGGEDNQTPAKGRVLGSSTKNLCTRPKDAKAIGFILNKNVPLAVERMFLQVFGRKVTHKESVYWKSRVRCDKATETKLKSVMQWHKIFKGQTMSKK